MSTERKGLVLGVYAPENEGGNGVLTPATQNFQGQVKDGSLANLLEVSGLDHKKGKSRVFYGINESFPSIAVVSLGKKSAGFNELEEVDEKRENIRAAVASGVKQLQDAGVNVIHVDPCGDPEAAAEGAGLVTWAYDALKEKKSPKVELQCFTEGADDTSSVQSLWNRGSILAEGQNFSRLLMEAPANVITPTGFTELAKEYLSNLANVTVHVRDREWAEKMKMNSFLSVTNGSWEPCKFLEIIYNGGKPGDAPFAIVGKGVTFDSGGISLKPPASMDEMRADMGGAACTLGSIFTAAKLELPVNVHGFMPLCENMPGHKATKPGDVVTAMNGKTIQVDNTDAEGRLILADALCYAQTFKPSGIIDMATLTGAMMVALGSSASGVFSSSTELWDIIHKAGHRSGDRVWRMPLFRHYTRQVTETALADLNNIGSGGRVGGACTAAAFLREFVEHDKWMHIDIAGVMTNKKEVAYLGAGMSATRTIVEFLSSLAMK
ncbi:hypothetical protein CAPTEDRAFT_226733 [Capitella teleta]|uniref:Cytosol aminopeptidase n=1 Tax=Capitella teleta TaxID=283909 RepID=N1PB62_CAPTE|nr:hypothetical protein CAPTEDRAFT_226733 [Capitella teleta]|eukprot:ELU18801.1 hypothetical protein CAPTEDRAFT_226733 [Capitella teleta]